MNILMVMMVSTIMGLSFVPNAAILNSFSQEKSGVIEIYQGKNTSTIQIGVYTEGEFTFEILDEKMTPLFTSTNFGIATYQFGTNDRSAGTYTAIVTLVDGTVYTASFTIL